MGRRLELKLIAAALFAFVTTFVPGQAPAQSLGAPELPRLFACQQGGAAFTVSEVPGLAAAAAGTPSGAPDRCAVLGGEGGAVAYVEVAASGDSAAQFAADLARHIAAKTEAGLEQRGGDPIGADGRTFQVKKYFGSAPFESRAWTDAEGGVAVGFTLSAPTREAHDKSYQAWRSFVRTWRSLPPAPGVN
jgi:hypothetical protein